MGRGWGQWLERWPLSWQEVQESCIRLQPSLSPTSATRSAPRRYSDEELIAIAASPIDPARCHNHLVEAISQLNALAEYAGSCSANTPHPSYTQLSVDATHARAQLEQSLDLLLTAAPSTGGLPH